MKDLFSKPVLATFLAAVAIIAAVVWAHHPATKPQTVAATNSAPAPVAMAAAPAPAAKPAAAPAQDTSGLPPVIPIPLTNVVIDAENGSWVKDKDYLAAPHKPQEFGGVLFLMDGMLQLQGRQSKEWKKRSYREDIVVPITLTNETAQGTEIVERGTNIASLHLLGATRYGSGEAEPFVDIIWHYTDGTMLRTPIEYLTHFRDWVRTPYEEPAHLPYLYSKVVWTAPQPSHPDQNVRLYRTTFPNPTPHKVISELEFSSAMVDPSLFIVGVTLDPLMPGLRPDPTPDLEPTDAEPPKKIQIFVLNSDSQPVPQAKLDVLSEIHNGAKTSRSTSHLTTDAAGALVVNYPPENLYQLSITASQDDYGSRKMAWNLSGGDTVPDSYTIKLGGAFSIGGIVLAPDGTPLPDSSISVYRFYSGGDDMNKKGDQPDFQNKTATTDTDGKWQVKGLPIELVDRIGFNASHAGYLTTNINLMNNASAEKELRDGTFTLTLYQGLAVAGRVVDDSDNPISGASVTAGQRYSSDRRTAKTDDEGHFTLTNVPQGDILFSATADGKAPDDETFTVKPDMGEIVLKLTAGKVVKGVVQDTNGAPIAGVYVQLQDFGQNSGYSFATNTDANGRFEWDSAPADPQTYMFTKTGYENKQNVTLPPDKDNTVIMQLDRQIQGQVVDADTGQPITKFTIQSGQQMWGSTNQLMGGANNSQDFNTQDGTFTFSLTQESENALKASADNYAPQVATVPAAQNGVIQMTIKLTSSPALRGKVVLPDGTPAPGVSVVITYPGQNGAGSWVQFQNNRFRSYGSGINIAMTDANGEFTLGSPPLSGGGIAAAGDAGFVAESIDQFRADSTLVLQPYGQIQGTLTIGGQPGVGVNLYFTMANQGINTDWGGGFKATTDAQGQFSFSNVPPGDGQIVRMVQTTPNSWMWSDQTAVTVKPGEITQVNLGDSGAVVRGTVRFDNPPTNNQSLLYEGNLSLNQPQEAQQVAGQRKYYAFVVNGDGSFSVDDVVPGNYNLNISVTKNVNNPWMHQIANGNTQVTVPDSFSPTEPIDAGEVELKPVPTQAN